MTVGLVRPVLSSEVRPSGRADWNLQAGAKASLHRYSFFFREPSVLLLEPFVNQAHRDCSG